MKGDGSSTIMSESILQKSRFVEITFKYPKTYRIEVLDGNNQHLLYVLHGYGQLSKFFIRKFDHFVDDFTVIAPEGMHRFYRNGTNGRVGASWMTKEMRETDIADNINWLTALDSSLEEKYNGAKKTILGFSQGGATAIRWAKYGGIEIDRLIIWGTDFPPEEIGNGEISVKNKVFVIGENDPYFPEERRNKLSDIYANEGFRIITYKGDHDIDQTILNELLSQNFE